MLKLLSFCALLLGLNQGLLARALGAEPDPELDAPITHFHIVNSNIFRGARPLEPGIQYVASELHAKLDIDLENDSDAIGEETGFAAAAGLKFVSIPLSGFWAPKDADVQKALALLGDSSNYPIFIHCEHGEDRTGLIVGLFRVFNEEWSPEAAYTEMKQLGFHPILLGLDSYFKSKTGL